MASCLRRREERAPALKCLQSAWLDAVSKIWLNMSQIEQKNVKRG
jgi:hypothetical protein